MAAQKDEKVFSIETKTILENVLEIIPGKKVEKKSGKRIGYNYIIIRSLKESQKNDVVKCLYIRSLTKFGFCVIKEGSNGDTKDRQGRDIKDRLMWQEKLHNHLQGKLKLPGLIGSFEENGNFYLVIQHISGNSYHKELKRYQRDAISSFAKGGRTAAILTKHLIKIAALLSTLHENGYVHRDVTPANFIVTLWGEIYLIDLELTYSLDNYLETPFTLGTDGYMSPEQKKVLQPTIQQDIFSLGAIILQTFSNVHPLKITDAVGDELSGKVRFLVHDKKLADLIIACLQQDPQLRPDIKRIREVLTEYSRDLKNRKKRIFSIPLSPVSKEQVTETVQQAIYTLRSPLMADEERGWFSNSMQVPAKDKQKLNKAWYASFGRGASGIMYVLSNAFRCGVDVEPIMPVFNKGLQLIEDRYINRIEAVRAGLHFGADGIAKALAECMDSGIIAEKDKYSNWINLLIGKETNEIRFENGIAGKGEVLFNCSSYLDTDIIKERTSGFVEFILQKQDATGSWGFGELIKEKERAVGFANGEGGIIWFLLEYGARYNAPVVLNAAQAGIRWLLRNNESRNGVIAGLFHKGGATQNTGLLKGTAGMAMLYLRAYEIFHDPQYSHAARKILKSDFRSMDDNFSLGSGLSGWGVLYIEAHRILREEEWWKKATAIADFIYNLKKVHPEFGPYWLTGNDKFPLADYFTGNAGVLHFLLRYVNPEKRFTCMLA